MYCKYCGKKIKDESKYCIYSGEEIIESVILVENSPETVVKPHNNDVTKLYTMESEYKVREKSTLVALLLWFFFGGLAAHRFYTRRLASGLILLILNLAILFLSIYVKPYFWIFFTITGIWLLVDLFLIRSMVREENYKMRKIVQKVID